MLYCTASAIINNYRSPVTPGGWVLFLVATQCGFSVRGFSVGGSVVLSVRQMFRFRLLQEKTKMFLVGLYRGYILVKVKVRGQGQGRENPFPVVAHSAALSNLLQLSH